MFTNKGNARTDSNLPALPEPAQQRRQPVGRAGIASIIANGVKITGTIDANGAELQVDGEIEGNVVGGSLTVGDTGMVRGDVVSESVTVHGRVEGSVRARKVMLARNAHVLGDIVTNLFRLRWARCSKVSAVIYKTRSRSPAQALRRSRKSSNRKSAPMPSAAAIRCSANPRTMTAWSRA